MAEKAQTSEFLDYLVSSYHNDADCDRLPPLGALSKQLDVSVSSLREQMEAARAFGLVEARPRTGLRRKPYSFVPAVRGSLMYAIALDRDYFLKFSDLRSNLEAVYWHEAVRTLLPADVESLRLLMARAWEKLRGTPIHIPQEEHRRLHLTIYQRLGNPFVFGILEAYWDAYEAVGLDLYTDYVYLEQVWNYHQRMVDAVQNGDLDAGHQALIEHTDLIRHRVLADKDGNLLVIPTG
jgi:DNA-binding FadR family transcriptional regulator